MNGDTQSRYTVWHFIGCGCTVLLLLGLVAAGGVIYFGKQMADRLEAGIKDPEARAARTREVLGYDELPEGYHPGITLSVPFFMDMVSLGDKELPAGEEAEKELESDPGSIFFERRGFLFMKMRSFGSEEASDDLRTEMNMDFDLVRLVGEGTLEAGGAEVEYVARAGHGHGDGERFPAISTELSIRCGAGAEVRDPYTRKALWFTEAPEQAVSPEGEGAEEFLEGTAADPEAMRRFLDHFDLCR